jgi:hypothetical protein
MQKIIFVRLATALLVLFGSGALAAGNGKVLGYKCHHQNEPRWVVVRNASSTSNISIDFSEFNPNRAYFWNNKGTCGYRFQNADYQNHYVNVSTNVDAGPQCFFKDSSVDIEFENGTNTVHRVTVHTDGKLDIYEECNAWPEN